MDNFNVRLYLLGGIHPGEWEQYFWGSYSDKTQWKVKDGDDGECQDIMVQLLRLGSFADGSSGKELLRLPSR